MSIICLQGINAQKSTLVFDNYNSEQGLSQNSVTAIAQDTLGIIWLGTEYGLNKFNGYKITSYFHNIDADYSILPGSIKDIVVDKFNQLWIANRGGLNCYNQETGNFYAYLADSGDSASIICNTVSCLLIDSENYLWVGTNQGLSRTVAPVSKNTQNTKLAFKSFGSSFSNTDVRCLYQDFEKNIWVGTGNGLNKIDHKTGTVRQFFPNENIERTNGRNEITSIVQDAKFRIWVGTKNGLFWLNDETGVFTDLRNHPFFLKNSAANNIKDILIDNLQRVFLATYGGGLLLFSENENTFYCYSHQIENQHSIANNSIIKLFEDKSGTLFAGMPGQGFCTAKLNVKNFKTIRKNARLKNSLKGNTVRELFADNQFVWIGLQGNGLDKFDTEKNTVTNYAFPNLKTNAYSPSIKAICKADSINLWLGTIEHGLLLLNTKTGKYKRYTYLGKDAPPNIRYVFDLAVDKNNNLWIISIKDGLFKLDGKRKKIMRPMQNNTENKVIGQNDLSSVYIDNKNRVWITSLSNGFFVFDQLSGKIENFHHNEQDKSTLISNFTTCIYQETNNVFWIGTSLGLCRFDYKRGEFENFTRKNGLKNEFINSIEGDNEGNLWVSTNQGLSRYNKHTKTFANFDIKDGLQGVEFNIGASGHTTRGELLFGGLKGFNIFVPENIVFSHYKPRITISDFQLFNKPVVVNKQYNKQLVLEKQISCTDTLRLNYLNNFIRFEFSADDYSNAKAIQYAYMLAGFEKDWNIVSSDKRTAIYTNLEPGNYTFNVKSTNADGLWQDNTKNIVVIIGYPFWKTNWFFFLVFVLGVLIMAFIVVLSNRWVIKQNKKLELDVARRTMTIEYKTIELADKITELKSKKEELEERTNELEKLNEEMEILSVVTHEMKNGLSILDPSGNLIFANKAFNELYRISPEEIDKRYNNNIFRVPFPEHIIKIINRCFTEKVSVLYEIEYPSMSEGKQIWVHSNMTPILSEKGDLKNVIVIDTDITDLKQRETTVLELAEQLQAKAEDLNIKNTELENKNIKITEQSTELKTLSENLEVTNKNLEVLVSKRTRDLKAAKEQAEKANQLKTTFLSNLSHEIRTPMNAICGFASLMGEENVGMPARIKYSKIINDNVDSLLLLVDNIMDLSKLQAKQIKLDNRKIDVLSKLTEIYYLYVVEDNYIKPNVEFKLDISAIGEVRVVSDEKRFSQIFTNLIDNAIKYTEEGSIGLFAEVKTIEYSLSGKIEARKILYISVADTGIGIKREEINEIFEHFRTIDDKIKLYRGTGLGLAIVQELLKIYNWEINVESTLGKGSKFTIKIPL